MKVKVKNNLKIILVTIIIFIVTLLSLKIIFGWDKKTITVQSNDVVEKEYIKWVNCNLTSSVMAKLAKLDIDSHVNNEEIKLNWIELIAYLSCKNGNDFKKFKQKDLDDVVEKLKSGTTMEEITKDMKYYGYYYESYETILAEFIGEYEIEAEDETGKKQYEKRYGIKAFLPIAKGYSFNHYDDFGASRSYGYKRNHLGNDLMGNIGAPIIAVESGTVEACGWNQYGGWRIGIRSFDQKRYYYYAHLRKNTPFVEDMYEGKVVKAGDVIGYLGMTGYSSEENVNNINVPHLHFGMQLIFDESQKEGINQIWVDVYEIINFLQKNKTEVYKPEESKDFVRKYEFMEDGIHD